MDMPPQNDQVENASQESDAVDLDARISDASDVQPEQLPETPTKPAMNPANPPPEHQPAAAFSEKGNFNRAEKVELKPEVKIHHSGGPERGG